MPSTLRLTKNEQEALREKCTEINKLLIRQGKEPVKDAELAHIILEKTISYVRITTKGEIEISVD